MSFFTDIQSRFPIRNTAEEKSSFRSYVLTMAEKAGWKASVEETKKHCNLIFGDPETAKVIFTAHYDTPRTSLFPNLMIPCTRWLFWLYQIGIVFVLLVVPSVAAAWGIPQLLGIDLSGIPGRLIMLGIYLLVYLGLFLLLFKGKKNPRNANDNTSGTATVLEIMQSLPEDLKDTAALILFDDEEKGKLGSKAFVKAHPVIKKDIPVINFDCVGYGEHFVTIVNKTFTLPEDPVRQAFASLPDVLFTDGKHAGANSDHLNFDQGIGVAACKCSKHGILYTDRIHTPKDTEVSEHNLLLLRDCAIRYVRSLK